MTTSADAATARAGLGDLVAACDAMLSGYPSSEAEDLAALAARGREPRRVLRKSIQRPERVPRGRRPVRINQHRRAGFL